MSATEHNDPYPYPAPDVDHRTHRPAAEGAQPGVDEGRRRRRRRLLALGLVVLVVLGAACGGRQLPHDRDDEPRKVQVEIEPQDRGDRGDDAAAPAAIEPTRPLSARSDHDLALFDVPGADAPVDVALARNDFGSPLVLLVTHVGAGGWAGWYEVLVPGRPNGRTAWVREGDVTVHRVDHEVEVDLAARTLRVLQDGAEVLTSPVAVGTPESPTPTGRFSLTDKLETGQPDGAYGPYALGLSARSDVLTEFAGGDAQVGIHGTNVPSSIGTAASHGCIRVPNEVAVQLTEMLALGTPVTVR